jgi:hypothetical protein
MSYSAKRSSVLNAHTPNEDNNDDSKDSFYQELEQVFCHFPLAPYAKSDFKGVTSKEEHTQSIQESVAHYSDTYHSFAFI